MEELLVTLHGARALVIGNGRIGKLLSQRLACLGADVTVSARSNADFAWISATGLHTLDTRLLAGHLAPFDVIFNTVPSRVLGLAELAEIPEECLVIDLASKPGGVDFPAAQQLGRRAIWALSLPGKVAPMSSAMAIRDTIYNILQEEGIL
ncbi:dipicolinate synthase [Intestinibacillus massiliensis]|uniref:dipicolinate synthase n=1 Tax=Intestinibacillus massiliensis TaxID=1871029 RepID=UPI001D087A94|nr:dipicolinate synthase [Intestinibacillus massiliensis]MCB6365580.1 dipicolinate synthase [Intestinibacillus massiliensis]